jgi:hypothetical protein
MRWQQLTYTVPSGAAGMVVVDGAVSTAGGVKVCRTTGSLSYHGTARQTTRRPAGRSRRTLRCPAA